MNEFTLHFVLKAVSAVPDHMFVPELLTTAPPSSTGAFAVSSNQTPRPFFLPQKGRSYLVYDDGADTEAIHDMLPEWLATGPETPAHGVRYVTQTSPFVIHMLAHSDQAVFRFGVYSEGHDILILSTTENVPELYASHRRPDRPSPWVLRLGSARSGGVVLNPYRVCRRWAHWNNASRLDAAQRFLVLNESLSSKSW